MSLVDDLKLPLTDADLERRRFLGMVGSGALVVAGIGTAITTVRYLEPNVFFEEDSRFVVGRPEEIAVGTVLVLGTRKVYVVRTPQGFYALSAVCTHLGCITRYERAAAGFSCPCHGSRFAKAGEVTAGPAPAPLIHLEIKLERGLLVVDTRKRVAADDVLRLA
jgi:cytochrome b6-f complex iron-sulfur subunit